MYAQMFKLQVNNLGTHATSEITLDDNGDKLLEYKVSNNANVLQFSERLSITEINENLRQRILPEVTFIETPLVLQITEKKNEQPYNLVSDNEKAWPYHWEDLLNKLKDDSGKTRSELCNYVYKDLSDLLRGELIYDTDKSDFFFVPTNTDNKLLIIWRLAKKCLVFCKKWRGTGCCRLNICLFLMNLKTIYIQNGR